MPTRRISYCRLNARTSCATRTQHNAHTFPPVRYQPYSTQQNSGPLNAVIIIPCLCAPAARERAPLVRNCVTRRVFNDLHTHTILSYARNKPHIYYVLCTYTCHAQHDRKCLVFRGPATRTRTRKAQFIITPISCVRLCVRSLLMRVWMRTHAARLLCVYLFAVGPRSATGAERQTPPCFARVRLIGCLRCGREKQQIINRTTRSLCVRKVFKVYSREYI